MKLANKRYFPPGRYPEGWYLVEIARNLPKGGLLQKEWMGQQIVAWRDGDGEICVSEAYCPHLGGHLGPEGGGCVRNGRLVCPFHGFEYDATGRCVATPNAPPPRTARLNVYETRETQRPHSRLVEPRGTRSAVGGSRVAGKGNGTASTTVACGCAATHRRPPKTPLTLPISGTCTATRR